MGQIVFKNLIYDVDSQDEWGDTELHRAIDRSEWLRIDELLYRGANVNIKNSDGYTPLHFAAQGTACDSHFKIDLLLENGADPNVANNKGSTPLHFIAMDNRGASHFKVIEMLLKNGADPNATDKDGRTPFYFLINHADVRMVQFFLNYQASIDVVIEDGENLLFPATRCNNNEEVLKFLLNEGLDVNHQSNDGTTPLFLACNQKNVNIKIIKCLLKNGADINIFHKWGTPLGNTMLSFEWSELSAEIIEKNANFILEYVDINATIENNSNILCINYYKDNPYCLWKMILKHLAKLESLSISLHPSFLSIITKKNNYNDYYKQCQEELLKLKNSKIPNFWITFYSLLIGSRKFFKNLAGNQELIKELRRSNFLEDFPTYGSRLNENLKKGIKRRELFDESAIALSGCLPIFNPHHLIVRDTLDCILSKKDLIRFCK